MIFGILMKLLVIGHGRHGKDTVCELLKNEYGFDFKSSSDFCAEKFIYGVLKEKYNYANATECYEDRHNHRSEWYDMISEYCREDAARLGREIFEVHQIYCGLRSPREFQAMRQEKVFDWCIWVDRSDHLPEEPITSMGLTQEDADYFLDNNGSVDDLVKNVSLMIDVLRDKPQSL